MPTIFSPLKITPDKIAITAHKERSSHELFRAPYLDGCVAYHGTASRSVLEIMLKDLRKPGKDKEAVPETRRRERGRTRWSSWQPYK